MYLPWGESRFTYGTTPTSYRYTGQRQEATIGLYYYGARWYDPALGRFVQADTVIPQGQGIQAWDRYAYANNNPLRFNDPTGHETVLCEETCEQDRPRTLSLTEMAALYGINFTGNGWTLENMAAVLMGVDLIARAFSTALGGAISAAEAFKNVYGLTNGVQFEFGWGNCMECKGAGGYTYSSRSIRFQTLWTNNPDRRIPNVIHELGHAFNNLFWTTLSTGERVRLPEYLLGHAQTSIPGFPDRDSTAPNYGYGGPFEFWQQSRDISASEEFADNFIGWTYNHWEGNAAGEMRATWMNGFMPVAVDLASNR